jgi:N-acetylmuramoyl-L-alanine amidase
MKRICIDPGHGGANIGGGSAGQITEKNYTLQIAFLAKTLFDQNSNYDCILTRQADIDLSIGQRAKISNDHNSDLFLSIHINRGNTIMKGAEVFRWPNNLKAHILGTMILNRMPQGLQKSNLRTIETISIEDCKRIYSNAPDWLDAARNIVGAPKATAILLEIGYIDNADDYATLTQSRTIHRIASAIYGATTEFKAL